MKDIYPGFSWSISQHMGPASDSVTMFKLLQCAHKYSHSPNFQDKITHEMTSMGLLTANIREDRDKPQLWRDYQQVLPELGLIVSTKLTRNYVLITPIGYQWLDGAIGYSELLTSQCLNYQYPNGYKTDISPALKSDLSNHGIAIPETRIELDAKYGVLIKPALLMLRILIQLHKDAKQANLSAMQCLVHLVPIKKNKDWSIAYSSLLAEPAKRINGARRLRHVQEWHRVLSYTDIFEVSQGNLKLSDYALTILPDLEKHCTLLEDETTFWIPTNFEKDMVKRSWFSYYGNLPIEHQWLRTTDAMTGEYISKNYCEGFEDIEPEESIREWSHRINLRDYDLSIDHSGRAIGTYHVNADNIAQGRIKTQKRSILHDEIVSAVAKKLNDSGYSIFEDKNSVDLLAIKEAEHNIIEVKTITQRNAASRLRLGIGQLAEYRFRHQLSGNPKPNAILVCSAEAKYPTWYANFFSEDLKIGLASMKTIDSFSVYTSGEVERILSA